MGSNKNSFTESLANFFTPKDNYEYRGGDLYEKGSNTPYAGDNTATNYGTLGQADSRYTGAAYNEKTNANPNFQNVTSGGSTRSNNAALYEAPVVPQGSGRPTTMQRVIPGLALGAAGFGPIVAGGAMYKGLGSNQYGVHQFQSPSGEFTTTQDEIDRAVARATATKKGTAGTGDGKSFFGGERSSEGYTSDIRKAGVKHPRIEGAFFKKDDPSGRAYKINAFGNSYEVDTDGQNIGNSSQIRRDAEAAALPDDGGIAMVRPPVGTQATVTTNAMPAISAMSEAAASGAFMPIPDPNYDPNDPMSSKYIINPTYDQIAEYQKSILGMARGGEVESALGGNEKDLINDAEKAIRGELDETRASIILAQYVQQYGEDALRDLVDSVRSGSAQETRDRFARGDNGYVNGNGDGSGTDDKVPAKLKEGDSEQDVLLATKEFVFKESAATALENAGVSLDKINDAGANAPKVLREYFTG